MQSNLLSQRKLLPWPRRLISDIRDFMDANKCSAEEAALAIIRKNFDEIIWTRIQYVRFFGEYEDLKNEQKQSITPKYPIKNRKNYTTFLKLYHIFEALFEQKRAGKLSDEKFEAELETRLTPLIKSKQSK